MLAVWNIVGLGTGVPNTAKFHVGSLTSAAPSSFLDLIQD